MIQAGYGEKAALNERSTGISPGKGAVGQGRGEKTPMAHLETRYVSCGMMGITQPWLERWLHDFLTENINLQDLGFLNHIQGDNNIERKSS